MADFIVVEEAIYSATFHRQSGKDFTLITSTIWSSDPATGGIILQERSSSFDTVNRRIIVIDDVDGPGPQLARTVRATYNGTNGWADLSSDDSVECRYLFTRRIDQLLASNTSLRGEEWYLANRAGTIHEILQESATVVSKAHFGASGNVVSQIGWPEDFRLLFTGRELDSALGFYYFRARNYEPLSGRFMSEDPMRFAAREMNLYCALSNSPPNFIDPTGAVSWTLVLNVSLIAYNSLLYYATYQQIQEAKSFKDCQDIVNPSVAAYGVEYVVMYLTDTVPPIPAAFAVAAAILCLSQAAVEPLRGPLGGSSTGSP